MDIGPGRIINDFIEPNRNQYVIPVYQRNYEWALDDCKKLFEDIVNAHKRGKLHFCGSIVYAPLNTGLNLQSYVIIDGQQRLTTIYLLLKALLDMSEKEYDKELIMDTIINQKKQASFEVTEATKLKLKPVKSDNKQLLLLMDNKYDEIDRSSGIWHNYELFCRLITQAMKDDEDLRIKDIYNGIDRLTCAKILLSSDDNAQEIFERINSTGVPLSLADKIRNFTLMTDVDQDRLFEEYWLKVEQLIKKDYRNDFFYSYLNLKLDEFAKEKYAYDQFKDLYRSEGYDNESMLAEILHYAELYHSFMYGSDKYSNDVNRLLSNLQALNQTTTFLFLYRVFDDFIAEVIDEKELVKILNLLVSYSVRRIICEIASNSLRGLYKTLYARVFNVPENKEHYYDSIVSFLTQLTSRDEMPSDAEFVEALKKNDLYHKYALCRFLLTSVENQGKEQLITDNLTVEHIMPQNKNLSTSWQNMLGPDYEAVRNTYLHTLGNLTLTGYNSELGDRPFMEKQEMLDDVKTKVVVLYEDVKGLTAWNKDTIEARAEKLSGTILNLFRYDRPEKVITFTDPRYKEYSCDNPADATYKTPNYFVFMGERIKASNFAELLRIFIDKLYELDSSIIESMARSDEKLLEWSSVIMFSYDYTKTWGSNAKVADSEIYRSVGFPASTIMAIISALLDRYGIDHSEFTYSAKDGNKPEKTATAQGNDQSTRVHNIVTKWAEAKAETGDIHYYPEKSTKQYTRFTRDSISNIIPDTMEPTSGWGTKTHQFYEINSYAGKFVVLQLAFNSDGLSSELEAVFNRINERIHFHQEDSVWHWAHAFMTEKVYIDPDWTEDDIINVLDRLYNDLLKLEKEFIACLR